MRNQGREFVRELVILVIVGAIVAFLFTASESAELDAEGFPYDITGYEFYIGHPKGQMVAGTGIKITGVGYASRLLGLLMCAEEKLEGDPYRCCAIRKDGSDNECFTWEGLQAQRLVRFHELMWEATMVPQSGEDLKRLILKLSEAQWALYELEVLERDR